MPRSMPLIHTAFTPNRYVMLLMTIMMYMDSMV